MKYKYKLKPNSKYSTLEYKGMIFIKKKFTFTRSKIDIESLPMLLKTNIIEVIEDEVKEVITNTKENIEERQKIKEEKKAEKEKITEEKKGIEEKKKPKEKKKEEKSNEEEGN
jgi:hypothetical protein